MYNVTLRANAFWQDGTPITSDDVLFTISLLRSQYSAFPADVRSMWDQVEITRLDNKNIKFTLPEPFVPFLDFLTFGILPQHLLETVSADQLTSTDFNLAPVGSGPYKFDHLTVESGQITGVVLTASKNYYGPDSVCGTDRFPLFLECRCRTGCLQTGRSTRYQSDTGKKHSRDMFRSQPFLLFQQDAAFDHGSI